MIKKFHNVIDVIEFVLQLSAEIGDSNPFEELNRPGRYSEEERTIRNALMDKCFEVCARQNQNVKCLVQVLFNEALTTQPPA